MAFMNKYNNYVNAYRYSIMAGALGGTFLRIPTEKYGFFTLGALIYIINSQIRITLNKHVFFLFSIIFDVLVLYYMNSTFSGYIVLMLMVTLVDIMLKLKTEAYSLLVIVTAVFSYCIVSTYSMETGFIFLMFYMITFLLLLHLRRELSLKTNVESLYEELRRSNYELESARSRLVDYSKQVEKITKLEERNRISRELHDSIGHNLTGILMQVDAAMQVLEVNKDKGMEILGAVYKNINTSIEAVRQTVRKIRPMDYKTNKSSIMELISKFSKATGVKIDYKTSGVPYELLPSVEMVLYRNVQEALTNAVRHGHATEIQVHSIFKPESTEVVISDNGTGCKEIKRGFGLSGMEERLEIIGGSIKYKLDKGFVIQMHMPRREL
jgi:signal transduction histidine kinase